MVFFYNKNLGKFDHADRLFDSINDIFLSVITNVSDFREFIPELYCLPEIFINLNNN